jgi:hypothetical protein
MRYLALALALAACGDAPHPPPPRDCTHAEAMARPARDYTCDHLYTLSGLHCEQCLPAFAGCAVPSKGYYCARIGQEGASSCYDDDNCWYEPRGEGP